VAGRVSHKTEQMEAVMSLIDDFKTPCKLTEMHKGFCTREQMAVFLHRLAEKIGG
jgi:hypothetical protein